MTSDNKTSDIVFLGGGAAGLFGASVANTLGAKTCIIEKTKLGGDCTWYGCMPSKALLKSASIVNCFDRANDFGLNIVNAHVDTSKVMSHVRDIVSEIATHHPNEVFEKRGIEIIIGNPKFINKDILEVNGEKICAKKIVICTGSHPIILPIEGLDKIDYLTNETIFDLEELPESLIVLGGGPIGVELSQALNRLGVKVSVVEMMDRILFREDKEVAAVLEKVIEKEGIILLTGQKAIKFQEKNGEVFATLKDKEGNVSEVSAEAVLVAIGRAPNVEGLDLKKAGVKFSKKGIEVNSYLQTSNKNIFACGDIVGPYQFSHVAGYQASVCVRNALFKRLAWSKVNYANVGWGTFTEPEIAHVGLTEEEAKEKHKDVKVYMSDYSAVDRAITDVEKEGLVKIITDKKGYLLGAHIAGANAGEVIQGFVIAKSLKLKVSKLAQVLYIYPTLSELVKKTSAKALIEKMDNPIVKFLLKILRKQ